MTQLKRIDGSIIAESDSLTLAALVEQNKADLSGANISWADLSYTNLSEANLSYTNFSGSDLSYTNLSEADLYKANLYNANFSNANLSGTYLSEANLSMADLYKANLSKAKGIVQFGPAPTSGRIGYCVDHGDKIMVQLGCWWGELDKTIQRIAEVHSNEIGRAYADMVKSAARSLEVAR